MKKIIILIFTALISYSCADDFDQLNIDPKSPTKVPAEPLYNNAMKNLFDQMASASVNENVFRMYAQYWAQTTYSDESNYNIKGRNLARGLWRTIYRDVLKDLKEAKTIVESENAVTTEEIAVKNNKLAIIATMEVYSYSILVDVFGDVPYTEALDDNNVLPKYDDDEFIYNQIITTLDNAISGFNTSYGSFSKDPVYGGVTSKWFTFANSLKLRLAMRLSDVNPTKANQMAVQAAPNVMTSNEDNASISYFTASPNTNPLWVTLIQSGRADFVPANTVIDVMNDLGDPRRSLLFKPTANNDFVGGVYGEGSAYTDQISHFHDDNPDTITYPFEDPTLKGTILNYAEVEFLLAEALSNGFSVGGTVEEHYNNGIEASILEWGGTNLDVTTYLVNPDVAYTSASGDYKQKIGIQKWLALVNQGFEGWTTWRKLDFTALTPPPGLTMNDIPVRFTYPSDEPSLNGPNYEAASAAIGGDVVQTKVFWDIN